ncbi:GNAT family N-acetyltransferase [Microbulbifer variabilis]|uniref:GNAT family N-acetyltransferase n=1 Tax=Microbulbifer variabilis TaxID=266805 RepID=A0ABY4VGR8_9GAMM|nr:GNAT family N-acetyltransferase [Microbulbifer variabilis]USD22358.1 GNAT family N-acetyltransferase [Microbulbifer variabilis]
MANFEIRKVEKNDIQVVVSLLQQLGYEPSIQAIESLISNPICDSYETVVGILDKSVVSVMSVIYFDYFPSAERFCRITAFVVDSDVRGYGVGTRLIDFARDNAAAKGCSTLEVTTSLKRESTQQFYESIGFTKTSYKYVQKLKSNV